jgi:hypothetical protein
MVMVFVSNSQCDMSKYEVIMFNIRSDYVKYNDRYHVSPSVITKNRILSHITAVKYSP